MCLLAKVNLMPIFELPIIARVDNTQNYEWDYEKKGPETWSSLSAACGGTQQSPIDISFDRLKCASKSLKLLQLNDYEKYIDFKFVHDGYTITAYPIYEQFPPEIDGGDLSNYLAPYQLIQFHFHWGISNN